jgi:hypothetical protein
MASAPETRRSLGMTRFEGCEEWPADVGNGKLLQIKFRGLFQVCQGILNSAALTHRSHLWARGHVEVIFAMNDRCEDLHFH